MALLQSGTRIYGTANVDTQVNVGANLYVNTSGITITGNTTTVPTITLFSNSTAGSLNIGNTTSTSLPSVTVANSTGNVSITATSLSVDGADTINATGVYTTGTVNAASHTVGTSFVANSTGVYDTIGNVRNVIPNSQTTAYTLVATDNGKYIDITTGGVTVPASIFSAGQNITIYNDSTSNQTITQASGVTMYLAGTATTGNRTLAQRGLATVLCVAANTFIIAGAGVT